MTVEGRVLVLLARDLGGRAAGRVTGLRSNLETLAALGWDVHPVVVSRRPLSEGEWARRFPLSRVDAPSLPAVAVSATWALLTRRRSLNESLFHGRRPLRQLRQLVARIEPDVIVIDSIRLVELAESLHLPYVLDLDDLLSVRYREMLRDGHDTKHVLGYFGESIPRPVRIVAGIGARALLGWESRVLSRREADVARRAPVTTLVSEVEVARLSRLAGRPVRVLPPAVAPAPLPAADAPRSGLFFLGGLDYGANLHALRWYRDDVMPLLHARGVEARLSVIGRCPEDVRAELEPAGIAPLGFVEDLVPAMQRYVAMVAPIVSGGGIKTKVAEAMACGVPVVGTPSAFVGLPVVDGRDGYVGADPGELAERIAWVLAHPAEAVGVGLAGRDLVARHFGPDVVARRWRSALNAARGLPEEPVSDRDERSATVVTNQ